MRSLLLLSTILLLSAIPATSAFAEERPPRVKLLKPQVVEKILGGALGGVSPEDAKAMELELRRAEQQLRSLGSSAPPAERRLVDRLLLLVDQGKRREKLIEAGDSKKQEQRVVLRALLQNLAESTRDSLALYPGDADFQIDLVFLLYWLKREARALNVTDAAKYDAIRDEAFSLAKALVKRFPENANVHRIRGLLCLQAREETPVCLRHFARCALLDKKQVACSALLDTGKEIYVMPFCTGPGIRPGLAYQVGLDRPFPSAVKVKTPGGATIYLHPSLRLEAKDIGVIRESFMKARERSTAPEAGEQKVQSVLVELTSEGWDRIARWRVEQPQLSEGSRAVLLDGGSVLGSGAAIAVLDLENIPLTRLCRRIEKRTLPADLAK